MKKGNAIFIILLIPMLATAQFEQKVSISLSAGGFSTIGTKTYMPEWGSSDEDREPLQMSNYKPGIYSNLGIQFNLNRNLSLQVDIGIMYSENWFYDDYDGVNYTAFAVYDTITDDILAEGYNEFKIINMGIGLTSKYYLLPGKKINPFLFGGLNFNFTSMEFQDNEWKAHRDAEYLEPDDSGPDRASIEENKGLGVKVGAGIEYSLNDKIGFFLNTGYYLVLLKKDNFYVPEMEEHLHALTLQAGLRLSFIKSKDF